MAQIHFVRLNIHLRIYWTTGPFLAYFRDAGLEAQSEPEPQDLVNQTAVLVAFPTRTFLGILRSCRGKVCLFTGKKG